MVKVSRNFRLDPAVLEDLQRLSRRWEVSQARVLELLVREAVAEDKVLKMELVAGEKRGAESAEGLNNG